MASLWPEGSYGFFCAASFPTLDTNLARGRCLTFIGTEGNARNLKTKELWGIASAKLRGHYNYYGVTDNLRGIARFGVQVKKLLFKWLNRRGKKNSLNWASFAEMLKRFPLPKPRIKVSMFAFR